MAQVANRPLLAGGRVMREKNADVPQSHVCNSDRIGRILKSDYSGRSCGVLVTLALPESVQNHLMHMGFVPDALVTVLRRAPAGDPTVYGVDGMEIALRHETAEAIRVRSTEVAWSEDTNDTEKDDAPKLAEAAR